MASIVISGDVSGACTISAPSAAGTPTLTLPTTSGTILTTAGGQTVPFAAGSAAAPSITFTGDTNTGIFSPAADTIAFSEGGVESMRIDSSGNVGIGTSSPNERLMVAGAIRSTSNAADWAASDGALIDYFSGDMRIVAARSGANSSNITFTNYSSGVANERMRIASSGNLQVFASNTTAASLTFGASAGQIFRNENSEFAFGLSNSSPFPLYIQGRTSTNTQRDIVLNPLGGNIGIGTNSPGGAAKLDVIGNITIDSAFSSQFGLCFRRGFESSDNLKIYAGDTGAGRTGGLRLAAFDGIAFGTGSDSWQERMRISSSGDVFVGGTTQNTSNKPVYSSNTAKAWVNYDQSTSTIRGSFNVSSITNNGTGDFTINFGTGMPNANYVWAGSCGYGTGGQTNWLSLPAGVAVSSCVTTNSLRVKNSYGNALTNTNIEYNSVIVFAS